MNDLSQFLRALIPVFGVLLVALAIMVILGGLRHILVPVAISVAALAIAYLVFARR